MTMLSEATPSQIEAARAHLARRARWDSARPVRSIPRRPAIAAPKPPVEAIGAEQHEVWPPYMPMAPYDVCMPPPFRPTGRQIIQEVAAKHNLRMEHFLSDRRFRHLCDARQEAYYRLIAETGLSYPQVGRLMGGRDHTTILSGLRKHAAKYGLPTDFVRSAPLHRRGAK